MAKKHRNKQTNHIERSQLPSVSDPSAALQWWREKIRTGFPADGAAENLLELSRRVENTGMQALFGGLKNAVDKLLRQTADLKEAPRAVSHLVRSDDNSSVYVSSATGGIQCHSLPDGKKRWSVPAERAFQVGGMTVSGGTLFYSDAWKNRLCAVKTTDGSELWCAESAADGSPLLSPAGLAVLEREGAPSLVVCDSASHRLCLYTLDGAALESFGLRGLSGEEHSHLNTAPRGTEIPPYFEYPRAVSANVDIDGEAAVFVWDSGNCRVVVLDSAFRRKRIIRLAAETGIKPRMAGQVRVVDGPSGPMVVVINDAACTLSLRSPEGDPILCADLAALTTFNSRALDTFRLECGTQGDGDLLIAAGSGRLFALNRAKLDSRKLAASVLPAFPEDCRLVLAAAGYQAVESWRGVSPVLDHAALVRCLLSHDSLLYAELSTIAGRISRLAGALESGSLPDNATALKQALDSQLQEIRTDCFSTLERLSSPLAATIDSWSDALCEVDMEVFQSRGRSSSAELTMDHLLEEVRELRPSIRRCGWRLREVQTLLCEAGDECRVKRYATQIIEMLTLLLDRRLELLSQVAGKLEYDREPQRVSRAELQAAHAARLRVSAIEGVAVELVSELVRLGECYPAAMDTSHKSLLDNCLGKSNGLACYATLSIIAAAGSDTPTLPSVPELPESPSKALATLVEKMSAYLKQVQGGENGSMFARVLERQKKLFSVKASVLANYYVVNGSGLKLLERARRLSGDAWEENRFLRPAVAVLEDKI